MTPEAVLNYGNHAMTIMLSVCAPILIVALLTGLVISLLQAVTQINEATLSFLPKLLAVMGAITLAGPWMLSTLVDWIRQVITSLPSAIG